MKYLPVTAIVAGGVFGYVLTVFGNYSLFGSTSKLLAVLIGSAWVTLLTFATKISDITESPTLSPGEHEKLEAKCKLAVKRIWTWSVANFCCVIVVLIPSAIVDARTPLYHDFIVVAGMAAGLSVYSIVLHAKWQEELREFRSTLRLRERERTRQKEAKALFASGKREETDAVSEEISKLNKVYDWPSDQATPH